MGYEVDFLAVGEQSRSGDAIILRYGNLQGGRHEQTVVVVDGGFSETGEKIIAHIKNYYETDYVDIVVLTHPDADHAAGLTVVLQELRVGQLWMHKPWNHAVEIARMFRDGRVTDASVEERLRRALDDARELERIAERRRIPIVEPFTGVTDRSGRLAVVGPTLKFYESLLPSFRCTPEPASRGIFERLTAGGRGLIASVKESLDIETLSDNGDGTSAENESSAVILLRGDTPDDPVVLLTADAGMRGLNLAADILQGAGYGSNRLGFIQVPHHGSRRNVGPSVLDRLLGPKLGRDGKLRTAFVSAARSGEPKHPARKVTNAFRRRGSPVYATRGANIWHQKDAPERVNYSAVTALPFYDEVDE